MGPLKQSGLTNPYNLPSFSKHWKNNALSWCVFQMNDATFGLVKLHEILQSLNFMYMYLSNNIGKKLSEHLYQLCEERDLEDVVLCSLIYWFWGIDKCDRRA